MAGDYDLLAGSQFAADPDVLRRLYTPSQRSAYAVSRVDDPELNALLEQAYQELDSARRSELYGRAQRLILERVYSIPTYVLIYTIGAARKVRDLRVDVHGFPNLHDAWVRRDS